MLYETLYTFADHYLRLLCVNFGRLALRSWIKKKKKTGGDVFLLIYYLHWATEWGKKRGWEGWCESGTPARLARRCQE